MSQQLLDKYVNPAMDRAAEAFAEHGPPLASNRRRLPLIVHLLGCAITMAALIPPVLIWRARTATSRQPRIHIFQDMDHQPKLKAQTAFDFFADRRAMREPVTGTIAVGELHHDTHYYSGKKADGSWAIGLPQQIEVDDALLARGQQRFGIFCLPCHGADGSGLGPVHSRAQSTLAAGTLWTQPMSLHGTVGDDAITRQPLGRLFNTITHGARNMRGYGPQIPVADRWAIVAYVKALQRSQNAKDSDVPAEKLRELQAAIQAEIDAKKGQ